MQSSSRIPGGTDRRYFLTRGTEQWENYEPQAQPIFLNSGVAAARETAPGLHRRQKACPTRPIF
jgi:hypothetical protein